MQHQSPLEHCEQRVCSNGVGDVDGRRSTVSVMILRAGARACSSERRKKNAEMIGLQVGKTRWTFRDRVQAEGAEHRPERGRCRPILMIGAALRKNGSGKEGSMTSFKLAGEEDRYSLATTSYGSALRNRYHDGWSNWFHRG
ncbi:MAG: hypothetical protein IPF59_14340 [Ignavibacteria bacterium]|nr:hypothetical protein [Ignavibacteria bacterium]